VFCLTLHAGREALPALVTGADPENTMDPISRPDDEGENRGRRASAPVRMIAQ
jgi:hypothetical protein